MAGLLLAWAEISILVNTQLKSRGYRAVRADLTDTGSCETIALCIYLDAIGPSTLLPVIVITVQSCGYDFCPHIQAVSDIIHGGDLVTTVCHSTPVTVDTTPPSMNKVNSTSLCYSCGLQMALVEAQRRQIIILCYSNNNANNR